ncbi:MAG: hypothetical protein ACD_44C00348G0006 [uncultured bacterium]|nr:MAG: hypothetical protein ACD_44C00348G0006 [uncultured bacterium]
MLKKIALISILMLGMVMNAYAYNAIVVKNQTSIPIWVVSEGSHHDIEPGNSKTIVYKTFAGEIMSIKFYYIDPSTQDVAVIQNCPDAPEGGYSTRWINVRQISPSALVCQ